MKKIYVLLILVFTVFLITGCKMKKEKINYEDLDVVIKHNGQLNQTDKETSAVEFSYVLSDERAEAKSQKWFLNNTLESEDNTFKLKPIKNLSSEYQVYVEVIVTNDEGQDIKLKSRVLTLNVEEEKVDLKIEFEGTGELNYTKISETGVFNQIVKALVLNDEHIKNIFWEVTDDKKNKIDVTKYNGKDILKLENLNFGKYYISAQIYNFPSNQLVLENKFGDLVIKQENNKIISNFSSQTNGVYKWYKKDIKNSNEFVLIENSNNKDLDLSILEDNYFGVYKLEFYPNNSNFYVSSNYQVIKKGQGIDVSSYEELVEAIKNLENNKIINLTKDINIPLGQSVNDNIIRVRKSVYLNGNGYKISAQGMTHVFEIRETDSVYFENITIANSSKYSVEITNCQNIYFDKVIFEEAGLSANITKDPGAGLFILGSNAILNDIKFINCSNGGIRVEEIKNGEKINKVYLTLTGYFIYDKESLLAPIVSARSFKENTIVVSKLFNKPFAVPTGDSFVQIWRELDSKISYKMKKPHKVEYEKLDKIDFSGVKLEINLNDSKPLELDMSAVYLFFDKFKNGAGLLKVLDAETRKVLNTYQIFGYDKDGEGDKLIYKDFGNNFVIPRVPNKEGYYLLQIIIGNDSIGLDLGYIKIRVK